MKKATCLSVLTCFLLAGLIAFNSLSYLPNLGHKEPVSVSATDHGAVKTVCDFPIEEKEGEGRLGQKNHHTQFLIYPLHIVSLPKCDKVRFYFAYHIPVFLQGKRDTPIYLANRSILI